MHRFVLALLFAAPVFPQTSIIVRVDLDKRVGPTNPIGSYFGYDEPNHTGTANRTKLVGELVALAQKLTGDRVQVQSTGAVDTEQIIGAGVRVYSNINALATREARSAAVMMWNYHDDDLPGPEAAVHLQMDHLPKDAKVTRWSIDQTRGNSYTAWEKMGAPQQPTLKQIELLQSFGQPSTMTLDSSLDFDIPRQSVSLFLFQW